MHRSATSFAANWLHRCGMDLGSELIGATKSNKLGHFEDKGILEFHEDLLRFNNATMYAGIEVKLDFNSEHLDTAIHLSEQRSIVSTDWGWKQPRACLFFSLWREVSPNAVYFLMFRDSAETISSIYNREFNKIALRNTPETALTLQNDFIKNKDEICEGYMSMWIRHNNEILDHLTKINESHFLLFKFKDILGYSQQIIQFANNQWDFQLSDFDANEIFQEQLMHKTKIQFNSRMEDEAKKITAQLQLVNEKSLERISSK